MHFCPPWLAQANILFSRLGSACFHQWCLGLCTSFGNTIIKWTAVKATCVFVNDIVYVSSYVLVACVCKFLLDCMCFNAFVNSCLIVFDYSRGIPCVLPKAMLPVLKDLQRTSVLLLWHPKFPEHPLSGVGVVPTMTPRVGQLVWRLLRNLIQMGDDERDCPRKTAQGELNDGTWPMSSLIGTATWGATLTLMPSIFFRNL